MFGLDDSGFSRTRCCKLIFYVGPGFAEAIRLSGAARRWTDTGRRCGDEVRLLAAYESSSNQTTM